MSNKFIFDVDGTITPSRGIIDVKFKKFFNKFCLTNEVYLVTGSDKPKTIEQISESTYNLCKRVYNCNGNDVWEKDINIRANEWVIPKNAQDWLSEQLIVSNFNIRAGLHFEHRPGMVNFSVVGRNANNKQRAKYTVWDKACAERDCLARNFNLLFPDLEAKVGGETGIDISPKGYDKSQIIKDFNKKDQLLFFGDRTDPEGNDYPLKKTIADNHKGITYQVDNWQHTWDILQNEYFIFNTVL